jgi:hypothetical protein
VQVKGAFDETVLGILKLKDKGQRVEIRVVLHAITAPRITASQVRQVMRVARARGRDAPARRAAR